MSFKWSNILGSLSLFLFVLLMVFYWGYNYLEIPGWLSIMGRFHPLILHIPIGIYIGSLVIFYGAPQQKKAFTILYDFTIFSALVAAIAGLFLARIDGYESEIVTWHKHLGVAFASLLYVGKILVQKRVKLFSHFILGVGSLLLIITGHKGAEITHGKNFLFPEDNESILVLNCSPDSSVYKSLINPILQNKCVSCHRPQKRKGGLVLTDTIQLEVGGDNGTVIDRKIPVNSTLLKVIDLPLDDDKHMPPEGKVQLTDQEKSLLRAWIEEDASYHKSVKSYNEVEVFQIRCSEIKNLQEQKEKYSFPAANSKLIESVQNEYLSLQPVASGSPALVARAFVASEYNTQYLKNLLKVKEQLVQLDLSYMALGPDDFKILPEFQNLEKLSLNYTPISEENLLLLTPLTKLQSLSIAGIKLTEGLENYFENNTHLNDIYLGTTELPTEKIKVWEQKFPDLDIHYEIISSEILPLTQPMVINKKDIYEREDSIILTSPVPGTTIRYTMDGTIPDSLNGMIYKEGIPVTNITKIMAIAMKKGWTSSPMLDYSAFLQGVKPDSMVLQYLANAQYPGEGVNTFFDNRKAEISSLRDKKWIAFREKPLVLDMYFTEAHSVDSLVLSYGIHIPSYVFPPSRITLLAKKPSGEWEKLADHYPTAFLSDNIGATKMSSIVLPGNGIESNQYRLEVKNLPSIPSWHPGKGQKGWLFVDEVFLY